MLLPEIVEVSPSARCAFFGARGKTNILQLTLTSSEQSFKFVFLFSSLTCTYSISEYKNIIHTRNNPITSGVALPPLPSPTRRPPAARVVIRLGLQLDITALVFTAVVRVGT